MSEQLQMLTVDQFKPSDDAPEIFVPNMLDFLEERLNQLRFPDGVPYADRRGSDRTVCSIESQVAHMAKLVVDFASTTAYQSFESLAVPEVTRLRAEQLIALADLAVATSTRYAYWENNHYDNGRPNSVGRFAEWAVRRPTRITFRERLDALYPAERHTEPEVRTAVASSSAVRTTAYEERVKVKQGLACILGQGATQETLKSLHTRRPTPDLLELLSDRRPQTSWAEFVGEKPETLADNDDDFMKPLVNAFGESRYATATPKNDDIPF